MATLTKRILKVLSAGDDFEEDSLYADLETPATVELPVEPIELPARWSVMRLHEMQRAFYFSTARFNIVPAGRRSGKTELAKRRLVKRAMKPTQWADARYIAGAPTHLQAKRIFWKDLKRLVPGAVLADKPSESELTLSLINGAEIMVVGLDSPERIEGQPINGGVLDEYGNMKEETWPEHIRPMLSERNGWMDFIGAPEGRNHYYELDRLAAGRSDWARFHWTTGDILPLYIGAEAAFAELQAAREELDELTYSQEYDGSFVTYSGLAYYGFTDDNLRPLEYRPQSDLYLCFDFNIEPGVLAAIHEYEFGTGVFGEVYVPRNSNTEIICRRLLKNWGKHEGHVYLYGDATGGAKGTAKVRGSDWDIIRDMLRPTFGDRLHTRVGKSNPSERRRINAMNSRVKSSSGTRRLFVDPQHAPETVRDFQGVMLVKGGSGEIDKKHDPKLTHLTDGIGYYVYRKYGVRGKRAVISSREAA